MTELDAGHWLGLSDAAICERIVRDRFGSEYSFSRWQATRTNAKSAVFVDAEFELEWVLTPGGRFHFGLTDVERAAILELAPNPLLNLDEMGPTCLTEVEPFLILATPVTAAQAGTTAFADTVGPLNTALFTEEQIERIASVLNSSFPTEAEWEYACRAGTTSVFWFGNSIPLAPELIRILGLEEPLLANAFGLSSLFFGEWCSDFWTGSHSADAPIEHAAGRVIKGGAARFWPWHDTREWSGCVSSFRMPSIDTGGAGAAVRLVRRIG